MNTRRIGIIGRALAVLFALAMRLALGADSTNQFLPAVPEGYYLQEYDDCGVEGRQPHIVLKDCYLWTFATSDTDAGPKQRSAMFSYKGLRAVYEQLDPHCSYVLALTYASDHVYHRVQSLEANGIVLHGPYALPNGKATRVIVKVPPAVVRDGKMTLAWKIHGEVNATVSIIELWANKRGRGEQLRFASLTGLPDGLQGQVLDFAYDPVVGATVRVDSGGKSNAPLTTTGNDGIFNFSRKDIEPFASDGRLSFVAESNGRSGHGSVSADNVFFKPVHYRPLPAGRGSAAGRDQNCLLLDGIWAITTNPLLLPSRPSPSPRPLTTSDWAHIRVPGQWLQHDIDVPKDKPAVMAREFAIPEAWAGQQIILRFDAVHAGTHYWLNGRELGYSENLFTPVEWDITDAARPGQTNRLELEMKVATVSEALSYMSDYAFHSLGGIDRSARLRAAADASPRAARGRGPRPELPGRGGAAAPRAGEQRSSGEGLVARAGAAQPQRQNGPPLAPRYQHRAVHRRQGH